MKEGYGIHITRYENMSDENLYSMYREAVFTNLSEEEKLDLLQETVNRDALERGELGSPRVDLCTLSPNVSGNASDGVIRVNREMVVNQRQSFEYKGEKIVHELKDANMQALNTVIHENVHCWQDQIVDGTIKCEDDNLKTQYQANDFTTSAVFNEGRYHLGCQYLSGQSSTGFYTYYFQSTERDAFRFAEIKTDEILNTLEEKYGTENSFTEYARDVECNGYNAMEQRAIQLFDNVDFEKEVNQVLMNQYYNLDVPVDLNIESVVKDEMISTYESYQNEITYTNYDRGVMEEEVGQSNVALNEENSVQGTEELSNEESVSCTEESCDGGLEF